MYARYRKVGTTSRRLHSRNGTRKPALIRDMHAKSCVGLSKGKVRWKTQQQPEHVKSKWRWPGQAAESMI